MLSREGVEDKRSIFENPVIANCDSKTREGISTGYVAGILKQLQMQIQKGDIKSRGK